MAISKAQADYLAQNFGGASLTPIADTAPQTPATNAQGMATSATPGKVTKPTVEQLKAEVQALPYQAREALRKSSVPTQNGGFMLGSINDPLLGKYEGLQFNTDEWAQTNGAKYNSQQTIAPASDYKIAQNPMQNKSDLELWLTNANPWASNQDKEAATMAADAREMTNNPVKYTESLKQTAWRQQRTQDYLASQNLDYVDYLKSQRDSTYDPVNDARVATKSVLQNIFGQNFASDAASLGLEPIFQLAGIGQEATRGLARGTQGAIGALGGFAEQTFANDSHFQWAANLGASIADQSRGWIQQTPQLNQRAGTKSFLDGGYKDPGYYAYQIGSLIPHMGAAMAAGTAGAAAGAAMYGPAGAGAGAFAGAFGYSYAVESGSLYNDLVDSGVRLDQARQASQIYGAVAASLESIIPTKIAGKAMEPGAKTLLDEAYKQTVKQSLLSKAGNVLYNVGMEGLTEGAQEFASNVTKRFFDENQDIMQNVLDSFVGGTLGGALGSIVEAKLEGNHPDTIVQHAGPDIRAGGNTGEPAGGPSFQDQLQQESVTGSQGEPGASPVQAQGSMSIDDMMRQFDQLNRELDAQQATLDLANKLSERMPDNDVVAQQKINYETLTQNTQAQLKTLLYQYVTQTAEPVIQDNNVNINVGKTPDGNFIAHGDITIDGQTITVPPSDTSFTLRQDAVLDTIAVLQGYITSRVADGKIDNLEQAQAILNSLQPVINEPRVQDMFTQSQELVRQAQDTKDFNDFAQRVDLTQNTIGTTLEKFYELSQSKDMQYVTAADARRTIEQLAGDMGVTVRMVQNLATPQGKRAFGAYSRQLNQIFLRTGNSEVADIPASTPYHEVAHAYFQTMIPKEGQTKILDSVREAYNTPDITDKAAEETLVEDLKKYADKQEARTQKYGKILGALITTAERVGRWLGWGQAQNKIDEFYDAILGKKRPSERAAFQTEEQQMRVQDTAQEIGTVPVHMQDSSSPVGTAAVSGLTLEKLQKIVDLGGVPMPSVSITENAERAGDVTLVMSKEALQESHPTEHVYGAQVYTSAQTTSVIAKATDILSGLRKTVSGMMKDNLDSVSEIFGDQKPEHVVSAYTQVLNRVADAAAQFSNLDGTPLTSQNGIYKAIGLYAEDGATNPLQLSLRLKEQDIAAPFAQVEAMDDALASLFMDPAAFIAKQDRVASLGDVAGVVVPRSQLDQARAMVEGTPMEGRVYGYSKNNRDAVEQRVQQELDLAFQSVAELYGEKKDKVALHNLNLDNFEKTLELGGLPVPSIAITKAGTTFQDYGDITLVMNRDVVNPDKSRAAAVYNRDVYSLRFPDTSYAMDKAALDTMYQQEKEKILTSSDNPAVQAIAKKYPYLSFQKYISTSEVASKLSDDPILQASFLAEKGVDLKSMIPDNRGDMVRKYGAELVSMVESAPFSFFDNVELSRNPEARSFADKMSEVMGQKFSDDALTSTYNHIRQKLRDAGSIDATDLRQAVRQYADFSSWISKKIATITSGQVLDRSKEYATLDNIVAEMTRGAVKAREEGMLGIYGLQKALARGAKKLETMSDIQNATIGEVANYDEIVNTVSANLIALHDQIAPENFDPFDSYGSFYKALGVFLSKSRTIAAMKKELSKAGFDTSNAEAMQQIHTLITDMADKPVTYLEAKIQRAVDFNEVAAVVAPAAYKDRITSMVKGTDLEGKLHFYEGDNTQAIQDAAIASDAVFQSSDELYNNGTLDDAEQALNDADLGQAPEYSKESLQAKPMPYEAIETDRLNKLGTHLTQLRKMLDASEMSEPLAAVAADVMEYAYKYDAYLSSTYGIGLSEEVVNTLDQLRSEVQGYVDKVYDDHTVYDGATNLTEMKQAAADAKDVRERLLTTRVKLVEAAERKARTAASRRIKTRIAETVGAKKPWKVYKLSEKQLLRMRMMTEARAERKASAQTAKLVKNEMRQKYKEKVQRETALASYKKLQKYVEGAASKGGKIPVARMREIMAMFDEYQKSGMSEATLTRMKEIEQRYANDQEMPPEIRDWYEKQVERMSQTPLSQMSTQQIDELNNEVHRLVELGRAEFEARTLEDKDAMMAAVEDVLTTTKKISDGDLVTTREGIADKNKRKNNKLFFARLFHAFHIFDQIDGDMGFKGKNVALQNELAVAEADTHKEYGEISGRLYEAWTSIKDGYTENEEAYISAVARQREGADLASQNIAQHYGWGTENADGSFTTILPDHVDGLTLENAHKVVDVTHEILEEYGLGDRVGAVFEAREKKPFNKMGFRVAPLKYADVMDKGSEADDLVDIDKARNELTKNVQDGFTNSRQQKVNRMPRTDIFSLVTEGINDSLRYIHQQPVLDRVSKITASKEYKAHAGSFAYDYWREYLNVYANGGRATGAKSAPWASWIKQNMSLGILGYKISSAVVQPTSVLNAYWYIGLADGFNVANQIFPAFAKVMVSPGAMKNVLTNSEMLQLRAGTAGDVNVMEMQQLLQRRMMRDGKSGWEIFANTWQTKSMEALQWLDMRAAGGVWQGVYDALIKNGATEDAAKARADMVVRLTQGSTMLADRPLIYAQGDMTKLLTVFQTFTFGTYGLIHQGIVRAALLHGSWSTKAKALVALAGIGFTQALGNEIASMVNKMIRGEEDDEPLDEKIKRMLAAIPTNLIGTVPFMGSAINGVINQNLMGQNVTSYFSNPLLSLFEQAARGVNSAVNSDDTATRIKGGLRATEQLLNAFVGVGGVSQIEDVLERFLKSESEKKQNVMMSAAKRAKDMDPAGQTKEFMRAMGELYPPQAAQGTKPVDYNDARRTFNKYIIQSGDDPVARQIAKLTKNEEKAVLINDERQRMSPQEYGKFIGKLMQYQVISENTMDEVAKLQLKR